MFPSLALMNVLSVVSIVPNINLSPMNEPRVVTLPPTFIVEVDEPLMFPLAVISPSNLNVIPAILIFLTVLFWEKISDFFFKKFNIKINYIVVAAIIVIIFSIYLLIQN